jgi:hypothetical protein
VLLETYAESIQDLLRVPSSRPRWRRPLITNATSAQVLQRHQRKLSSQL